MNSSELSRSSLQKTQVTIRASRNFVFNSPVGLVRHERILLASDNWRVENARE